MAKKILIIEDEPDQIIIFRTRLKANGYETVAATDGETGLQKISDEKPDLVLLDINIPKISGLDICKKVKSNPKTKNIPIIILSAGDIHVITEQSLEAGADACLNKLYEPNELLTLIENLTK
jgi:DNA-binding response OmpR family regulator